LNLTSDKKELEAYLKEQGWIKSSETIESVEKPGEGNMNFTQRVKTASGSFIIKQSRDYVEKYPQVAAPEERALREAEFYKQISIDSELSKLTPNILQLDKENHVLMMEDLGEGADFTFLYQKDKIISEKELLPIIEFAARLHKNIKSDITKVSLRNMEMRKLNHEHIFQYPYMKENGLNLDHILPGLQQEAEKYKQNEDLKNSLKKLGDIYLENGESLLHGDYFPGSWLKTADGIKIIDPEFCHFGHPEFEMGVTIAHLKMADQPEEIIQKALEIYLNIKSLDESLRKKFTAVEILRRILGLAQLPLEIDLQKRVALLEESREEILKK
jgi:5-methylthioribose kinase